MRAGDLNEEITVEKMEIFANDFGEEQTIVYTPKIHTRAQVIFNSGSRNTINNEVVFPWGITFIVRVYHPIDELDRIVWKGKNYRILSIEPSRQFQLQNIRCELINE